MPPPPKIPEYPEKIKCRSMFCNEEGTMTCTRCKGAKPETRYCGKKCQTDDWKWHKKYCGKQAYTFKIELLGSKDPVITRVVDVPAWYNFQYFHFVLQYAFGPWQQCHLHQWSFSPAKPNRSGCISLAPDQSVLNIIAENDEIEEPLFGGRRPPFLYEKNVKLSDIYNESGRYSDMVQKDGKVLPLMYLYDFGDNWEHRITFKGVKNASCDRPLFISATGYPPAEDAGGVSGWEEVKEAFAAERPTKAHLERRDWAIRRMQYEDRHDPLAEGDKMPYSPFNKVNVTVMNYEGRWENHLEGYLEGLGETI
ncbi:MM3350-like domain-containing protein [Mycena crocata]|nr:MM3350-like domain-containing protein [Mycena crocata]